MESVVHKDENVFENGVIDSQRTYWSQEIADILEITTSTLRRWSIDLEKAGYNFYRDEHNRRAYFERDLKPLRKLQEFLNNKMSMMDATTAVVAIFPQDYSSSYTLPVHRGKQDELRVSKCELEEIIQESVKKVVHAVNEQQESINKELLKQLQQQQEYIKNSLEERDRQLMISLKESLETRKQLALSQEHEEKLKKWWCFWR